MGHQKTSSAQLKMVPLLQRVVLIFAIDARQEVYSFASHVQDVNAFVFLVALQHLFGFTNSFFLSMLKVVHIHT